jgi:uncharacterized membrane protein YphA (DoxX/SURF4 family)
MAVDHKGTGLAIVRIFIGTFLIAEGCTKLPWLLSSEPLVRQLTGWLERGNAYSLWYLHTIALPGAPVFARLVLFGELAAGTALVLGVFTRPAAVAAALMVLNFHVASARIFHVDFLTNGYGLPVLGALIGLAVGGKGLPLSLRR